MRRLIIDNSFVLNLYLLVNIFVQSCQNNFVYPLVKPVLSRWWSILLNDLTQCLHWVSSKRHLVHKSNTRLLSRCASLIIGEQFVTTKGMTLEFCGGDKIKKRHIHRVRNIGSSAWPTFPRMTSFSTTVEQLATCWPSKSFLSASDLSKPIILSSENITHIIYGHIYLIICLDH